MRISARRLNRTTLQRQLLLGREQIGVVDAVRRVAALQAQDHRLAVPGAVEPRGRLRPRCPGCRVRRRPGGQGAAAADHPARRRHGGLAAVPHRDALPAAGSAAGGPAVHLHRPVDRRRRRARARAAGVPTLVRRYLAAFGPASAADFTQFTILPRARTAEAFEKLAGELVEVAGPDGRALLDLPDAPLADEQAPAPPRLLGMWDNALLGWVDRSRVIPAEYRKLVMRSNGDVLPTLLVDGQVAGVGRPVDGGIEATAFHPLPPEAWEGLATEASELLALLADRDPAVYRRYSRWWDGLPAAEVRVLR